MTSRRTNRSARRVREQIFAVLPKWFTEQAIAQCRATIEQGDGTPLHDRIERMVAAFGELGVKKKQLEQRLDKSVNAWTVQDVANMGVLYRSVQNGEVQIKTAFPAPEIDAKEIGA